MRYIYAVAAISSLSLSANAAESNFYIDAGLANLKVDVGINEWSTNGASITTDEDDNAVIIVAGYPLMDNVSLEGGLLLNVDASFSITADFNGSIYDIAVDTDGTGTVTAKTEANSSYMLGAAYKMPLNDQFSIDARAGILFWDVDYKASANVSATIGGSSYAPGASATLASRDGSDPYFGLGATYELTDDVAVKANLFRTEIDGADIEAVALNLSMKF
jgi:opacity protein-like surface antigen